MNIEGLTVQEVPASEQTEGAPPQDAAEITPLLPESYKLVGGGGGAVLLG